MQYQASEIIALGLQQIDGMANQTVNARDLWKFVESNRQFTDWIKYRIEKYKFIEGQDYIVNKIVNNPLGGRPTLEYRLSIDMGKELAIVENNDKGRQVRRYFIECERLAKLNRDAIPKSANQVAAVRAWAIEQKRLSRAVST